MLPKMCNIAILIVTYNRTQSLKRLLSSLKSANYEDDKVTLIISIDNSGNDDVYHIAKDFDWQYGEKIIHTYPQRLGLRKHILTCGMLTNKFNNLIVLEDDLYVSNSFYHFAKEATEFYKNDTRIAGISLYSYATNHLAFEPFTCMQDEFDVYFMQQAMSWGQIWSKEKWNDFVNWYEKNNDGFGISSDFPQRISGWPETSWLKYHDKYCVEKNKYFVYPKISLSTNFCDSGEHNKEASTGFQVVLQQDVQKNYHFAHLDESNAVYDIFFENIALSKYLNINDKDLCTDLYGVKANAQKRRYHLTASNQNYKITKSFGLSLRPHDANIFNKIEGNYFKLYDTSYNANNKIDKKIILQRINYDIINIDNRSLLRLVFNRIKLYITRKIKK
jgi:hypothetical protein